MPALDINALQEAFRRLPYFAVNKVLKKNTTTGRTEWTALEDADLPVHGHAEHDNRTRRIMLDLAAGFQTAGTGTKNVSAGLRITLVDAETGTWRWQIPLPADIVSGSTATLNLLWDCVPIAGNAFFGATMGSTGAGVAHSNTNLLNETGTAFACNGTTTLQTLSTFTTSAITAGDADLAIQLNRLGGNASDTINADVQLRAIWVAYTADM